MIFFFYLTNFSNKFSIFLNFLGTTVNLYDGEGVGLLLGVGLLEGVGHGDLEGVGQGEREGVGQGEREGVGQGLLVGLLEGVGVFVGQGSERVFETDFPQNELSR